MSNIVPLIQGRMPAVFAGRANLPDMNSAAQQGLQAGFAVIGTKGRNWRVKYRSEEELLMDARGVPVPSLDVVIVGVSPFVSKQWYEKGFEQDSAEAPDCFSVNGIAPDVTSVKKQSNSCALCPKNQWGSKTTDAGKKAKACQDNRRIAVVPLGDIMNESYGGPMMLRIPPMSLGNLAGYGTEMQRYGAQPFMVGTQLTFDYAVTYQLIKFTALGWLDEAQATNVAMVLDDPLLHRMLETEITEDAPVSAPASALASGGPAVGFGQQAGPAAPTIDYAAIAQAQAEAQARAQAEQEQLARAQAQAFQLQQQQQAEAAAFAAQQKLHQDALAQQAAANAAAQAQAQAQAQAPKRAGGSAFSTQVGQQVAQQPVQQAVQPVQQVATPGAALAPLKSAAGLANPVPYAPEDLNAAVDELLAS